MTRLRTSTTFFFLLSTDPLPLLHSLVTWPLLSLLSRTPSLQKPSNILLCSLASADCLTGITAQPMFVVWRVFLQIAQQSCSHQVLIFHAYYTLNLFTTGLSYTIFMIISFDRYYALSKPLMYRANATKRGKVLNVHVVPMIVRIPLSLWWACSVMFLPMW